MICSREALFAPDWRDYPTLDCEFLCDAAELTAADAIALAMQVLDQELAIHF